MVPREVSEGGALWEAVLAHAQKRWRMRVKVFLALVCLTLSAAMASAQVPTGTISGRVTDSSGGVLPGVTVTASSPNLQGPREVVTSSSGDYVLALLPPGTYALAVRAAWISSGQDRAEGRQHGSRAVRRRVGPWHGSPKQLTVRARCAKLSRNGTDGHQRSAVADGDAPEQQDADRCSRYGPQRQADRARWHERW